MGEVVSSNLTSGSKRGSGGSLRDFNTESDSQADEAACGLVTYEQQTAYVGRPGKSGAENPQPNTRLFSSVGRAFLL